MARVVLLFVLATSIMEYIWCCFIHRRYHRRNLVHLGSSGTRTAIDVHLSDLRQMNIIYLRYNYRGRSER